MTQSSDPQLETQETPGGPIDLTALSEAISVYRCPECGEISEESHGPVYECGNCGTTFSKEDEGSHRCPDCNKFAGKLAEDSVDCGCNAEAEEITAYACDKCDELVPENEAKAHECGVEPTKPTKPLPVAHLFASGQLVRVRPTVTIAPVHEILDFSSGALRPCYGPARVIGYFTPPGASTERVALRCIAHNADGQVHEDFLEALRAEDDHEHTWGAGELSGPGLEQCGVCFRVRRVPVEE